MLTGALPQPGPVNQPFTARVRISDNKRVSWSGSGTYAIVIGATAALPPGPTVSVETDNLFALNRLGNFAPLGASVFLGAGANGNALVGNFPSLLGNVAGNDVITRLP